MAEIELDRDALGAARQAHRSEFHKDRHTSWAAAFDAAVVVAIRAYLAALRPVSDEAVEAAQRLLEEADSRDANPDDHDTRLTNDMRTVARAALAHTGKVGEAAADVLAERQRQKDVEGWTPEHDDTHDRGEMAKAAVCYADPQPSMTTFSTEGYDGLYREYPRPVPSAWPWHPQWWKPTDRRRDLVKAAALIIAEIERLDRSALQRGGET